MDADGVGLTWMWILSLLLHEVSVSVMVTKNAVSDKGVTVKGVVRLSLSQT